MVFGFELAHDGVEIGVVAKVHGFGVVKGVDLVEGDQDFFDIVVVDGVNFGVAEGAEFGGEGVIIDGFGDAGAGDDGDSGDCVDDVEIAGGETLIEFFNGIDVLGDFVEIANASAVEVIEAGGFGENLVEIVVVRNGFE